MWSNWCWLKISPGCGNCLLFSWLQTSWSSFQASVLRASTDVHFFIIVCYAIQASRMIPAEIPLYELFLLACVPTHVSNILFSTKCFSARQFKTKQASTSKTSSQHYFVNVQKVQSFVRLQWPGIKSAYDHVRAYEQVWAWLEGAVLIQYCSCVMFSLTRAILSSCKLITFLFLLWSGMFASLLLGTQASNTGLSWPAIGYWNFSLPSSPPRNDQKADWYFTAAITFWTLDTSNHF